jgi:hypothetical protein
VPDELKERTIAAVNADPDVGFFSVGFSTALPFGFLRRI